MRQIHSGVTTFKLLAAFFAIYVIWGSTYLAIRFAVQGLPPLLMMGARHLTAGALLLAVLFLRGEKRAGRAAWAAAVIGGALQFLGGHGLLAWAEVRVSSGLAALLVAAEPLVMVVLARLARQERLSWRTLALWPWAWLALRCCSKPARGREALWQRRPCSRQDCSGRWAPSTLAACAATPPPPCSPACRCWWAESCSCW